MADRDLLDLCAGVATGIDEAQQFSYFFEREPELAAPTDEVERAHSCGVRRGCGPGAA